MPRDGSFIYSLPPGTPGIVDMTVESARYNSFIYDVETEMNAKRPIIAGGTGADDAEEALVNLGAERGAAPVVNFDDHVYFPGSFYALGTAGLPGAPVDGHVFSGTATLAEPLALPPTNQNLSIAARDMTTGVMWSRMKVAGIWTDWLQDPLMEDVDDAMDAADAAQADADAAAVVAAAAVMRAGDTMSGQLGLPDAAPASLEAANRKFVEITMHASVAEALAAAEDFKYISPVTHKSTHHPAFWASAPPVAVGAPGAWQAISGFSETYDPTSAFNGASFQPGIAGWYMVGGTINMPTQGGFRGVRLYINSAITNFETSTGGGATMTVNIALHAMVFLSGSDFVQIAGVTDYVGAASFNYTQFWAHRLF